MTYFKYVSNQPLIEFNYIQFPGGIAICPSAGSVRPCLMYALAKSFAKNFELIAERKSVGCYPRERAKASVISKYLTNEGINSKGIGYDIGYYCFGIDIVPIGYSLLAIPYYPIGSSLLAVPSFPIGPLHISFDCRHTC